MRKRTHVVSFHLNSKELSHLKTQVELSGLTREELLRSFLLGAEIQPKPCSHHSDLLHKLAGLCNNANQLARIANTYGTADKQSVAEMTNISKEVWGLVKEKW